jgi:hypothetical protein
MLSLFLKHPFSRIFDHVEFVGGVLNRKTTHNRYQTTLLSELEAVVVEKSFTSTKV